MRPALCGPHSRPHARLRRRSRLRLRMSGLLARAERAVPSVCADAEPTNHQPTVQPTNLGGSARYRAGSGCWRPAARLDCGSGTRLARAWDSQLGGARFRHEGEVCGTAPLQRGRGYRGLPFPNPMRFGGVAQRDPAHWGGLRRLRAVEGGVPAQRAPQHPPAGAPRRAPRRGRQPLGGAGDVAAGGPAGLHPQQPSTV
jgi:hypothetical protein